MFHTSVANAVPRTSNSSNNSDELRVIHQNNIENIALQQLHSNIFTENSVTRQQPN